MFIARNFKEKNAFKMWLNWVNFRREFQVEKIDEASICSELNTKKAFLHGHDKEQRPCTVYLPRRHDPKNFDLD